jgi:hypothetical protein
MPRSVASCAGPWAYAGGRAGIVDIAAVPNSSTATPQINPTEIFCRPSRLFSAAKISPPTSG